jgi:MFS family permease
MNSALVGDTTAAATPRAGTRAWVTLALLSVAFFLSLLDRQILTVLIGPIKMDLGISDSQFGLLQGMAFAVFYVLFAVPVAIIADRWNRKAVIAGGLFLWSASTCAAGFARSFTWLFGARIGVGVGEACLAPAAYSMLTDLFGRKSLGRVIGIFHAVGAFGIAGSVAIGGALHDYFAASNAADTLGLGLPPWGMVLVAVGVPGIVLALLIALCVREPVRDASLQTPLPAERTLSQAFLVLWRALLVDRGAFMRLLIGSSLLAIAGNALLTWAPAYLMRTFELSPAQAGPRLGISFAIGAIVGPLAGGMISDRLFKRWGEAGTIAALVGCSVATAACYIAFALVDTVAGAAVFIAVVSIFYSAVLVLAATAIQLRAPPELRARISALSLCLNTVIGLGLGSYLVGAMTDRVFADPKAVGTSLVIVAIASSALGGALISTLLSKARR